MTVAGVASYFSSKKNTSQTQRVVYCYKKETHTPSLGLEHLRCLNIEHPEMLRSDVAAHVCVAVEYGGQAVFSFDRHSNRRDGRELCEGQLDGGSEAHPGYPDRWRRSSEPLASWLARAPAPP